MDNYLQLEMKCRNCGYKYVLALLRLYEVETCPLCGHRDDLFNFVIPEKLEEIKHLKN